MAHAQSADGAGTSFTLNQWLICGIAALGFAFDTYDTLVLPLIARSALFDLEHLRPGSPGFSRWVGLLFYIPAFSAGLFGFLAGYLTDRLGRRRVLVWSILLYSVSALAAGYATSVLQLLVLRCACFVGVSVEFVAAVAWLAELFSNPRQREMVMGYTQVFTSVGGAMVSGAYYFVAKHADSLPPIAGGHQPWRYVLISGVIPAIVLMVARPFLPESPVWQEKKAKGSLKRPSMAALFGPEYRKITFITAVMVACTYGASFGAIQQIPLVIPSLPDVGRLSRMAQEQAVGMVQLLQEIGGLIGRVVLAFLAVRIVSRRLLLRIFQVPGLLLAAFVFFYAPTQGFGLLRDGMFLEGIITVAQFSFWGNYLPRVYATYLRGTGESFAANIGGRMVGTSAALLTPQLAFVMQGENPSMQLAHAAGLVAVLLGATALIVGCWLPEPSAQLPE
jgi:predicted MFS family arabinose efflux permease